MKKRGAWQMAATVTREAPTFIFDSPGPMLDDPFFAPSVSASGSATLKDPQFQKNVPVEPTTSMGANGWRWPRRI